MKYLGNSAEIKKALLDLYDGPEEKWAVVAFVGGNALDYLPSGVSNLHVICWPKAGGTNPNGIRDLLDNGITVSFCKNLHDKIYFASGRGIIVGSPNLSENALGCGGLHEFAVYIDDGNFNIEEHLASIGEVREVTADALAELDIEDALFRSRNRLDVENGRKPETFDEAMKSTFPKRWKIVTWSEEREDDKFIKNEVVSKFAENNWENDSDDDKEICKEGDYVLQIKTNANGYIERANGKWLFVEHVINRNNNSPVIVQVHKIEDSEIPFKIDGDFKRRLKKAFNSSEWADIINEYNEMRSEFLKNI